MLWGEKSATIDEAGRIAIPAKFRRSLDEQLAVGLDPARGCIVVISTISLPQFKGLRYGSVLTLNTQGRLLLDVVLQEKAGLAPRERATVIAAINSVEIWKRERYEQFKKEAQD